jgi:hypothetical protein
MTGPGLTGENLELPLKDLSKSCRDQMSDAIDLTVDEWNKHIFSEQAENVKQVYRGLRGVAAISDEGKKLAHALLSEFAISSLLPLQELKSTADLVEDAMRLFDMFLPTPLRDPDDPEWTRPITMTKAAKSLGSKAANASQYCRRREKRGTLKIKAATGDLFHFNLDAFPMECRDKLK